MKKLSLFNTKETVKKAIFSDCRKYRYVLTRIWNKQDPIVFFIGLNPSTANEYIDDPTIRRCISFSKKWGFGGLHMGNIFAFRATDPKEMLKEKNPVGKHNNKILLYTHAVCDKTVLMWGSNGKHMNRDKYVYKLLTTTDLYCLGKNKNGTPKHILYLKKDTNCILYNP